MVFSSISFLFYFLPIFLLIYYLIQPRYRNGLLFSGSLVFYGFGEPKFVLLILLSIVLNYFIAIAIENNRNRKIKKGFLFSFSLIYNLGILIFFKYTNFFIENINQIARANGSSFTISPLLLVLPLGISFYTFQILSYVIDVYRGNIKAERNFITLGTYISMFPQLIAGPIVIYSDIQRSLKYRTVKLENLEQGLIYFIIGLGYKVVLANRIGILWNDICTIGYESISTPLAWLGALAYSLQLYFDFNGYSLMAIGLGEMLGFKMPENFRHPYVSRSVTEFWRRWHITLGTWFKEYIYIPLGGNRAGKLKTFRNLFIVWILVGFWHGASWNFVIWGLMIFVFQFIEKLFLLKLLKKENVFAKIFSHLYMCAYILVSWTVFAITDLSQLLIYLEKMFPVNGYYAGAMSGDYIQYLITYAPLLIICIIFCTTFPQQLLEKIKGKAIGVGIALGVFWYAVYFIAIGINNPFLYFRF